MGSGGEQTLASSASDKKRAAKFLEEHLMPDTRSASAMADGGGSVHPPFLAPQPAQGPLSPLMKQDTGLKGLAGWASDQGVSDALVVWEGQANKLLARLQVELNGLHGTKNIFNTTDTGIGTQANGIRTPSSFDGM